MWYRLSITSMESTTRKVLESLATSLVREHLLKTALTKPREQDVILGVNRVMKEIEREHGSITKAALNSPEVSLRPIVQSSIAKIKW